MGAQLAEIGNVADVITLPCFVAIFPPDTLAHKSIDLVERLQDRDAVFSPTANVIDLARPWILEEFFRRPHHVEAVYIVADLFSFIAEDVVDTARERHLNKIGKEAVEFHARVIGAREAAAPKNPHVESKISSVLLRQHIGGCFRSAKDRMRGSIDPARLIDAVPVGGVRVVVARCQFVERLFVRDIPVHLIRAQENKARFGTELPHRLENVRCSQRVHFKIDQRNLFRLVMRRLRGAVQNRVEAVLLEKREDSLPVANIQVAMLKPLGGFFQAREVPAGIPGVPKNSRRILLSTPITECPCRSKYSTASEPISPLLPVISVVVMPKE